MSTATFTRAARRSDQAWPVRPAIWGVPSAARRGRALAGPQEGKAERRSALSAEGVSRPSPQGRDRRARCAARKARPGHRPGDAQAHRLMPALAKNASMPELCWRENQRAVIFRRRLHLLSEMDCTAKNVVSIAVQENNFILSGRNSPLGETWRYGWSVHPIP
jgi:hypothetical protein